MILSDLSVKTALDSFESRDANTALLFPGCGLPHIFINMLILCYANPYNFEGVTLRSY